MKFVIIGLVLLMYSFITTFNWVKIGKNAVEKFSKDDKFSWKRLGFYLAAELVGASIFTGIVYELATATDI